MIATIDRLESHSSIMMVSQAFAPPTRSGENMAQNHYTSKTKRRPKNSNRKDHSAATMAALRQLEAAEKKSAKK
jgi:hypothetical protein